MKYFAANWKLHKNPQETRNFLSDFQQKYSRKSSQEVIFFPPSICLEAASQVVKTPLQWGAQNVYSQIKGAFTGETSAQTVADLGGKYILIGHSERRQIFHEKDELLSEKLTLVQQLGLTPMLCIGETLSERESGKTMQVLESQLTQGLKNFDQQKALTVAYEPVWAIGTGKVAQVAQVKEAHFEVRKILNRLGCNDKTPILYGGSVKPDNAKELLAVPEVGGFLVGGASLEVASFLAICASE
ncbi:MAG: triose-phosphate isomerase [Bdellovibrio sp. CG10_big_fil_rev_8_21_14_0_10_47_8]|nr:MAG: triose-phosphate isomerase [Bdellovibrio sp. CG10_big_fil_rev_8_21_14_0_10_47_8]